jgi:Hypervirulence associated proteins TUDOR domain
MASELKRGDRVQRSYRGTKVLGTVLRKVTERTTIAGRAVAASKDDPRFLVRSEKSGKEAAHKASALTKVRKRG